jgi:hypothetical protein
LSCRVLVLSVLWHHRWPGSPNYWPKPLTQPAALMTAITAPQLSPP